MTQEREQLLTLAQAAKRLGVAKLTLRRWTDRGELQCVRIGTRQDRRFRASDIEDYISARMIEMKTSSSLEVNE